MIQQDYQNLRTITAEPVWLVLLLAADAGAPDP
jgi:hypothetical protein